MFHGYGQLPALVTLQGEGTDHVDLCQPWYKHSLTQHEEQMEIQHGREKREQNTNRNNHFYSHKFILA